VLQSQERGALPAPLWVLLPRRRATLDAQLQAMQFHLHFLDPSLQIALGRHCLLQLAEALQLMIRSPL